MEIEIAETTKKEPNYKTEDEVMHDSLTECGVSMHSATGAGSLSNRYFTMNANKSMIPFAVCSLILLTLLLVLTFLASYMVLKLPISLSPNSRGNFDFLARDIEDLPFSDVQLTKSCPNDYHRITPARIRKESESSYEWESSSAQWREQLICVKPIEHLSRNRFIIDSEPYVDDPNSTAITDIRISNRPFPERENFPAGWMHFMVYDKNESEPALTTLRIVLVRTDEVQPNTSDVIDRLDETNTLGGHTYNTYLMSASFSEYSTNKECERSAFKECIEAVDKVYFTIFMQIFLIGLFLSFVIECIVRLLFGLENKFMSVPVMLEILIAYTLIYLVIECFRGTFSLYRDAHTHAQIVLESSCVTDQLALTFLNSVKDIWYTGFLIRVIVPLLLLDVSLLRVLAYMKPTSLDIDIP